MRKIAVTLGLLTIAAMLGCSSMGVNIEYNKDIDFAGYRTFRWLKTRKSREEMRMKKHPLAHRKIRKAVERELYSKGFKKFAGGKPDFLLTYHVGAKKKIDVVHHGYRYGRWGQFRGHSVSFHKYREGTLVLDIIDGSSKKLVWRGSAKDVLRGVGTMGEHISKSVSRLMKDFPPSGE